MSLIELQPSKEREMRRPHVHLHSHISTQVDVLPLGPDGAKVAAVNYFRDVATFLEAPVSPVGPASS